MMCEICENDLRSCCRLMLGANNIDLYRSFVRFLVNSNDGANDGNKLQSFTVVISTRAIAAEEEVKHNLPDNLEIIDPKSLGLSDSDVEKFLGNVKLLPIGG